VSHPKFRAAWEEKRVIEGFPDRANRATSSDSFDPLDDRHGHGTHGVGVLLKTAPNAVVYIARVADEDGKSRYDDIPKVISLLAYR
jgi:hypothetical protein